MEGEGGMWQARKKYADERETENNIR